MSTIAEIEADLIRASNYNLILTDQWVDELKKGCECKPRDYECLGLLIDALEWAVSVEIVPSAITEILYKDMLLIIGAYAPMILPTVNAGPDQNIQLPVSSITLTGTATQGTNPIVSTLWSRLSGNSSAVITTPNSLTTTVTGLMPGLYVFKLTATDSVGNTNSDTVKIVAIAQISAVYFGFSNTITPLTEEEIENGTMLDITSGSNYAVPWLFGDTPKFQWVAELITEPIKYKYQDVSDPENKGDIGQNPGDLFGVPSTVGAYRFYITAYPTQFSNPIELIINPNPTPPKLTTPNVTATALSSTSVSLSWTQPTNHNADNFSIWRGSSPSFGSAFNIASTGSTTLTDTSKIPNTTYYYFVLANASGYTSSDPGTANVTTPS